MAADSDENEDENHSAVDDSDSDVEIQSQLRPRNASPAQSPPLAPLAPLAPRSDSIEHEFAPADPAIDVSIYDDLPL